MKFKNYAKKIVTLGLGLGFLIGLNLGDLPKNKTYQQKWIEEFGTVEKPNYLIKRESTKLKQEKHCPKNISINNLSKTNAQLYFEIKNIDEVEISKQVFEELTNKKFPNIKINGNRVLWETKRKGEYNFFTRSVDYNIIDKQNTLECLLHEFGHVIAQHDEYNYIKSGNINNVRDDIHILEEASAYAFTNAGLYYLLNEKEINCDTYMLTRLSEKLFNENQKKFLDTKNEDDKWKHREGMILFMVTYKYFNKDPYKTFNYLVSLKDSDLNNLHPEIKEKFINFK